MGAGGECDPVPGPRTVAGVLRALGLAGVSRTFAKYHRVLSRVRWSGLQGALGLLVAVAASQGYPLIVLVSHLRLEHPAQPWRDVEVAWWRGGAVRRRPQAGQDSQRRQPCDTRPAKTRCGRAGCWSSIRRAKTAPRDSSLPTTA